MKKCILKISILCFLSVVFIGKSFGQAALNDSSYVQTALAQNTANFYKAIGQESRLYNGHEYPPYDPHLKGNALFPYDVQGWEYGDVTYDGIVYKNVPLKYDIFKDVAIVLLYNKFSMFALLSTKVHDFSFANHHFVRIVADSLGKNDAGLTTGFYDQLYGGKIEIVAKRSKTLQNSTNNVTSSPETYFISRDDYYLKKGNTYYSLSKSQGSVLKLLKDKKNELQQYLKDNKIRFRDDPEGTMAKMAAYYDQITK
jgi:hypothetical protein